MTAYFPVRRKYSAEADPLVPAEKLSRKRTLRIDDYEKLDRLIGQGLAHTLCSRGTVVPPLYLKQRDI